MDADGRDVVLIADDDQVVRDVEGEATIACLMQADRHLLTLRRELDELRVLLIDVAEHVVDRLAAG